jgi:hypothetical protein
VLEIDAFPANSVISSEWRTSKSELGTMRLNENHFGYLRRKSKAHDALQLRASANLPSLRASANLPSRQRTVGRVHQRVVLTCFK